MRTLANLAAATCPHAERALVERIKVLEEGPNAPLDIRTDGTIDPQKVKVEYYASMAVHTRHVWSRIWETERFQVGPVVELVSIDLEHPAYWDDFSIACRDFLRGFATKYDQESPMRERVVRSGSYHDDHYARTPPVDRGAGFMFGLDTFQIAARLVEVTSRVFANQFRGQALQYGDYSSAIYNLRGLHISSCKNEQISGNQALIWLEENQQRAKEQKDSVPYGGRWKASAFSFPSREDLTLEMTRSGRTRAMREANRVLRKSAGARDFLKLGCPALYAKNVLPQSFEWFARHVDARYLVPRSLAQPDFAKPL
ncbi:MAG: hypothetical protein OXR66_06265 [Candidatus Woesearchaeota archaeon]|nr:hypothetical protein [Candidatus Woesearchaeota archaeon]